MFYQDEIILLILSQVNKEGGTKAEDLYLKASHQAIHKKKNDLLWLKQYSFSLL